MPKILLVCANYGSAKDGIGHYSMNLRRALESANPNVLVQVLSNNIKENKFFRIISPYMTKNLFKALFLNGKIVIEYPFAEYCPFILFPLLLLAIFRRSDVSVSLHEYFRVNKLRRLIIDVMIFLFDNFLVTDEKVKQHILSKHKKVNIRPIPSNIMNFSEIALEKDNRKFVFFGLINHSKAITELIEAWKEFNINNKYSLYFISSSNLSNIPEGYGIKKFPGISDKGVDKALKEATFILLPIRPEIHINNASYIAGLERGCIPVGKFNSDVFNKSFISMMDYTTKSILESLQYCVRLSADEIMERRGQILKMKDQFPSFEKTAKIYLGFINMHG